MRLLTVSAVTLLGLLPLGGCDFGGKAGWRRGPRPEAAAPVATAYVTPPSVTGISRRADGALTLVGRAQPLARVRLATPTAETLTAEADAGGAWRVTLPAADAVRLFDLSTTLAGRTVQAEGYLAVMPEGRAAELRSGAGARVVGAASDAPRILAVDFDRDGAAVVSGVAKPAGGLQARVDRTAAGDMKAGKDGWFSILLSGSLRGGLHRIDVAGERGVDVVDVPTNPPPAFQGVFVAVRSTGGWRIDWMTPGGGAQTTLLLTRPGAGG